MMKKDFNFLEQTRKHFRQIRSILQANEVLSAEIWENLEKGLLAADIGPQASRWLRERLQRLAEMGHIHSGEQAYLALHQELILLLGKPSGLRYSEQPSVIVIMGGNGSGITTTAAQLSYHLSSAGKKVFLISKDLFRTIDKDTLKTQMQQRGVLAMWPDNSVDFVHVIETMLQPTLIMGFDVILIDTSDCLMTDNNNFGELKKAIDLIRELLPGIPHEFLGVFDSLSGQIRLPQFREMATSTELTGVILSKVEISAKVGCIFAVADDLGVPIKFLGVDKEIESLVPFDPANFVAALFE